MSSTAQKIIDEALALPDDERRQVAEVLLESLPSHDDVDLAWRDEIARRVQQVRDGEVELESWDDVRRHAREALARR